MKFFVIESIKIPRAPDIWHQQQNNNNHNNDEKLFILDFLLLASQKVLIFSIQWIGLGEHDDSSDACWTAGHIDVFIIRA